MKRWDLCWADVKFADSEQSKRRPVLIANVNDKTGFIVTFKITSQKKDNILQYFLIDWAEELLDKPCYVNLYQKIKFDNLENLTPIGPLTKRDIDNIKAICKDNGISLLYNLEENINEAELHESQTSDENSTNLTNDELKEITDAVNNHLTSLIEDQDETIQFVRLSDINEYLPDDESQDAEISLDVKLSAKDSVDEVQCDEDDVSAEDIEDVTFYDQASETDCIKKLNSCLDGTKIDSPNFTISFVGGIEIDEGEINPDSISYDSIHEDKGSDGDPSIAGGTYYREYEYCYATNVKFSWDLLGWVVVDIKRKPLKEEIEDDAYEAAELGGEEIYCRDCGSKLHYDEDGAYCPKCRDKKNDSAELGESIDDTDNDIYMEVASKQVPDSDGFLTDYTWYQKLNDDGSGIHIFMFGDKDAYEPDRDYADWKVEIYPGKEAEAQKEAQDWFDNYKGFEDEE